jgi:hypothetical protein
MMQNAKSYAALCASFGNFEPRYIVLFSDATVGVFRFGPDEVEDVSNYPGVMEVVRIVAGKAEFCAESVEHMPGLPSW